MKLDDAQKKTVIGWIEQGLKLSDIQKKLGTEMGLHPTYMEVRFLVDDLKVMPKDPEPPKQPEPDAASQAPAPGAPGDSAEDGADAPMPEPAPAGTGNVTLSLDQIARPGTMISGKVTFSDGNTAEWYLDQMGRLGVVPAVKGYKPSQQDIQTFQMELQRELQRMGF